MKSTDKISGFLCLVLLCGAFTRAPAAGTDPIPRPPELERDVRFWVRVYSEIDTNSGFLHDERNLPVVYETVHFTRDMAPHARQRVVEEKREQYVAALQRIAAASGPLSAEDQRIRDLWGKDPAPAELLDATQHIRFQLGQSDRFRAGLERSGSWQAHIAQTFAKLGLPRELAVLPHVESCFNPTAYSKVGAAGLWQFMRSTGRRYMRIDNAVDDRFDPFRSTEAAAQLLSYNYRLLGTWPLALTAYNHGAAGMRRARDTLGTDDIVTILRHYKSPSFGFASRNFYVSFLAALELDSQPEKYFGHFRRAPDIKFQEVELAAHTALASVEHSLKIKQDELRALNPGLRPVVWQGRRPLPKGYRLRLPVEGAQWEHDLVVRRLAAAPQPEPKGHVTIVTAQIESAVDAKAIAVASKTAARAEPVTAAEVEELGPALGPAAETSQSADPIDYSVAADNSIVVAPDETLGHYAEWLGTTAARLRQLNKMKSRQPVLIGRHIKLEFAGISRDDFEHQRREYHRVLQASYFAAHRIVGSGVYKLRRGDSLWTVTQRSGQLPLWLLQQYNPDVDMTTLRPGIELVVPKIEQMTTSG